MEESEEEKRLKAEWTEARARLAALRDQLEHPTVSRLHDGQKILWEEVIAVGDECHALLVKLRELGMSHGSSTD
jgi:hypothetical protein